MEDLCHCAGLQCTARVAPAWHPHLRHEVWEPRNETFRLHVQYLDISQGEDGKH